MIELNGFEQIVEHHNRRKNPLRLRKHTYCMGPLAAIGGGSALMGGLKIGFTALSAIGSIMSAGGKADIAEYNQELFEAQAETQTKAGKARAIGVRREGTRLISQQVAGFGAAGVRSSGTPLEVLVGQAKETELAAQQAIFDSETQAYSSLAKAGQFKQEARNLRSSAIFSGLSAFGRLLV